MPRLTRAEVITAKQLYLAGEPMTQIAAKVGIGYQALAKRAKRNNWQKDADKAMSKVDELVSKDVQKQQLNHVKALSNRQFQWKERVLALAERHIGQVEERSKEQVSLDDLEKLVRIADKTDLIGRRQLGMDIENQHNSLHLHVSGPKTGQDDSHTLEQENVIDVQEDGTEKSE